MRQNPHVRICGGPGSATTLVYPTPPERGAQIVLETGRQLAQHIGFGELISRLAQLPSHAPH